MRERRRCYRNRDDAPQRRILHALCVQVPVVAERDLLDAVVEARDLGPRAIRGSQVIGNISAVAVANLGEKEPTVAAALQRDFGDSRQVLAEDVAIAAHRRSELVKIDLLVEVTVFGGALVSLRVARVIKAAAVGGPLDAAAGGWIVHAGDDVRQPLSGGGVVDVRGALLAAIFGQRDRNITPIVRWLVEVDRGPAVAVVELIGVENHALSAHVCRRGQHHKQRLILRRLTLHREELLAIFEVVVLHRRRSKELADTGSDRGTLRDALEITAGRSVLLGDPTLDLGVRVVLEPAIVVDHGDAVVGVADGALWRGRVARVYGGSRHCDEDRAQRGDTRTAAQKQRRIAHEVGDAGV